MGLPDVIPRTQSPEPIELYTLEHEEDNVLAPPTPTTTATVPTHWRPKLTMYRLLVILITLGFSIAKAVLSYKGLSIIPITLEWLFSTGVFLMFFSLDTYQSQSKATAFPWFFEVDLVHFVLVRVCVIFGVTSPALYSTEDGARKPSMDGVTHPPVRGFDLLVMSTTVVFGTTKSIMAYVGYNTGMTTVEWIGGGVVGVGIFWLGLYESNPINAMPYLFTTDYLPDIKRTAKHTQAPILVFFQFAWIVFSVWWSYLCVGWIIFLSHAFLPETIGVTIFERMKATLMIPGLVISGIGALLSTILAAFFAVAVILISRFQVAKLRNNANLIWGHTSSFIIPFVFFCLLVFLLTGFAFMSAYIPEALSWSEEDRIAVFAVIFISVSAMGWLLFMIYLVVKVLRWYLRKLGDVVWEWLDRLRAGGVGSIARLGPMAV